MQTVAPTTPKSPKYNNVIIIFPISISFLPSPLSHLLLFLTLRFPFFFFSSSIFIFFVYSLFSSYHPHLTGLREFLTSLELLLFGLFTNNILKPRAP